MCARFFKRIKTVPALFSAARQNSAQGGAAPARVTDIGNSYTGCNFHATKSSITRGNLAGNFFWGSHAGRAPKSSVNTTHKFTTKEGWLKFGAVCTPVHPLISNTHGCCRSQPAPCLSSRVWEHFRGAQKGLNDTVHTCGWVIFLLFEGTRWWRTCGSAFFFF